MNFNSYFTIKHTSNLRILLLTLFFIVPLGTIYGQNQLITIAGKNITLLKAFDAIESQTQLSITYSRTKIDVNRTLSVDFKKQKLSIVLDKLLAGTGFTYKIEKGYIVLVPVPVKQEQTEATSKKIQGVIVDTNGDPVIGASIAVQGTTLGTITNLDGEYTLANVPENSEVTVSFIGYKTLIFKANDKALSKITLKEDTEMLDEVVVVGYGTVKKRDLTGSISSVNAQKIADVPVTSVVEALQGRSPGVVVSNTSWEPGSEPSIFVRGKRSITASNGPLYVVDGIPITGGVSEISPADIESMEILKDASATAIYGSRGANGVIIITTKQGKEGKTKVDYNGYVGFQTIQNKLDMMNGAEYAEYTREAYRNSTGKNKYLSDVPNKEQDMLLPMFSQDAYVLESVLMGYDENGNYDPSKVRSNDWFDAVTRQGFLTEHQLNIRGGGAKTSFMASATYNKVDGVVKDQSYQRYSVRLNLSHTINKYIKIGGQTQYSFSEKQRGSNMISDNYMYRITPLGSLYEKEAWRRCQRADRS